MEKRNSKIFGLFVFILIFTFTMTACDMVGNNAVEDTAHSVVNDLETGDLIIEVSGIEMQKKVSVQSEHSSRFTDFELEFELVNQNDQSIKYNKKVNLDTNEDILKDNFGNPNGNYSAAFTGLKEGKYNVKTTLSGYNFNTNQKVIIAAKENYEATCIAGMKTAVRFEILQVIGGLDITVEQFPSEVTQGELIKDVNVELLDLDGESVLGEMDFDYGIDGQNLLVEGIYPAYYTMVISWEGHGTIEQEIQVRVVPDKIKPIQINLFGSQLIVDVDWKAEPASPKNVRVEKNEEGFLISWDGVENADSYDILRKRTPYYHAHFAKVGEVVDTGDNSYEFQYEVLKPELFEIASYDFQVVSVRQHPHKDYDLTSEPAGPGIFAIDRATAWGGDSAGNFASGWWNYYDTQGPAVQTIFVNLGVDMGTVEIIDNEDNTVTIVMDFDEDWRLQEDRADEVVKIQGYTEETLPDLRPAPGLFDHKIHFNDLDIDDGTITIEIPAEDYIYYGIKLDVIGTIYAADQ